MLKIKNSHPRDEKVIFIEDIHKYRVIDNNTVFTSVTKFIDNNYPLYSGEAMIRKMMTSSNFKEGHKWFGKTFEEILEDWNKVRDDSSNLGKQLHREIEKFYNDVKTDEELYQQALLFSNEEKTSGWDRFKEFIKENEYRTKIPYRTEWVIYDEDIKIAGTIDVVFLNEDGTLDMYDWKRVKKLPSDTSRIIYGKASSAWNYILQQNLYKYIIERKYKMKIKNMYLVQLHPEFKMKTFRVPEIQSMVIQLLDQRWERGLVCNEQSKVFYTST